MNTKHLIIENIEKPRNQKLEPQLSEEFKNALSYYVLKLTAISNRVWSDYDLEAFKVRQLINSTALSGKFSDFAYTYFILQDIMKKKKCEK